MDGTNAEGAPRGGGSIPTNLRLLAILEEVAAAGRPVTPTAVNERLGLAKPTVHRLFRTLEEEGYLQRDVDGRSYAPGRRLRLLASDALSSLRIRTARRAILERLSEAIGETINLAAAERDVMIYIDRVETKWPLRIQMPIGARIPFHCSASGKLRLAFLDAPHLERYLANAELAPRTANSITDKEALRAEVTRTRARGFALDDEEFLEAMVALASPVLDRRGRLMTTLSFHAPTQRMSLERAKTFEPLLRAAAGELADLVLEP